MRTKYPMTDSQYETLMNACRPVPYLVMGGIEPRSPHENANAAWRVLGDELGFDHMTVEPDDGDQHNFTAMPVVKAESLF